MDRRTYEGLGPIVSLAVLLGPVIAASQVGSAGLGALAMAWPTVAASWLLLDALSGVRLYTAGLWAVGVLIVWVVVSYVALVAILNRQEL